MVNGPRTSINAVDAIAVENQESSDVWLGTCALTDSQRNALKMITTSQFMYLNSSQQFELPLSKYRQ